ncbi:box C/D snoRNA protein 1-like, partial [Polypterus senegalus]|uniref:box C/D snoRNA protein 1-like n=1 Tax=Polypterus senegalus TaxID=55291 RepID=UPI0019641F11
MDKLTDQSNVTEEKAKAVKRKVSLIVCESCGSEEAKYRCPGCLTHSCSLPCVKRHKLEVGCNGMRDRVAFVPLGKFNEMNLLSDYRFLEDVGRQTDGANRDDLIRKFTSNKYVSCFSDNNPGEAVLIFC